MKRRKASFYFQIKNYPCDNAKLPTSALLSALTREPSVCSRLRSVQRLTWSKSWKQMTAKRSGLNGAPMSSPPPTHHWSSERRNKQNVSKRMMSSAVARCLLDMAWPLTSGTHSSTVALHKTHTRSSQFPSQHEWGHGCMRSYWHLAGWESSFRCGYNHW